MLRFADNNNLEALLQKDGGTNLGYNSQITLGDSLPSRKNSSKYDIMFLHTMYNYNTWSNIMEHPFDLIGLAREPLAQFQSYFSYYHSYYKQVARKYPKISKKDAFDFFLENFERIQND